MPEQQQQQANNQKSPPHESQAYSSPSTMRLFARILNMQSPFLSRYSNALKKCSQTCGEVPHEQHWVIANDRTTLDSFIRDLNRCSTGAAVSVHPDRHRCKYMLSLNGNIGHSDPPITTELLWSAPIGRTMSEHYPTPSLLNAQVPTRILSKLAIMDFTRAYFTSKNTRCSYKPLN